MTKSRGIRGAPECKWRSRNCDGSLDMYTVKDGRARLCKFHGQAWPKDDETAEEQKRRLAKTRVHKSTGNNVWGRPPKKKTPVTDVVTEEV